MSNIKQTHNTIDDERLLEYLSSMPELPSSNKFIERTMESIEAQPDSLMVKIRYFFLNQHHLKWNFAGMAATMAIILCFSVGFLLYFNESSNHSLQKNISTVKFKLHLPDAKSVALAGNFSQWDKQYPLKRKTDGTWVIEIPLSPGEYEYGYMVNNKLWIKDPNIKNYRDDGFGNINTVLVVPAQSI